MITQEQHDEIVAELNQRLIEHRQGMENRITELRTALSILFQAYKRHIDSGDDGIWRLEDTDAGKTAMAALGIKDDGVCPDPVQFWETTFDMNPNGCGCQKCNPRAAWIVTCSKCGNKRCPKAADHELKCTNSNETNQVREKDCIFSARKTFWLRGIEWYCHIPGDPMPCGEELKVKVLLSGDIEFDQPAKHLRWEKVFGWRPLNDESKLPKEVPQC